MRKLEIADLFGEGQRTVQRWVKRFEQEGLQGMRDAERCGRPACLDAKQWTALGRDLRRSASDFGHPGYLWDGKVLSIHLKQCCQVTLGVRQCQRIFTQMGFRPHKPRPQVKSRGHKVKGVRSFNDAFAGFHDLAPKHALLIFM